MTLLEYEGYFRDEIASKKIIGHKQTDTRFLMLDDAELERTQSTLTNENFFMILHKPYMKPFVNEAGGVFIRNFCSFTIAQNIGKGVTEKIPKDIQNQAFIIAVKIIKKILKDLLNGNFPLGEMEVEKMEMHYMKGMLTNSAGITVDFELISMLAPYCNFDPNDFQS